MLKNKTLILALLLTALMSVCAFSMPATLGEYKQKRQEILSANIHASSIILSEAEQEADRRLELLKKLTNYRPDRPFYEFVSPENDQAVKTDLFYFLRQMPKGASLHSHSTALLSAKGFFDLCMNNPNIYIYTAQSNSEHLHGEVMLVKMSFLTATRESHFAGFTSTTRTASSSDFSARTGKKHESPLRLLTIYIFTLISYMSF